MAIKPGVSRHLLRGKRRSFSLIEFRFGENCHYDGSLPASCDDDGGSGRKFTSFHGWLVIDCCTHGLNAHLRQTLLFGCGYWNQQL